MKIRYLFSSPEGDIPADKEILGRPFLLSPSKSHPELFVKDYFESMVRFLLESPSEPLRRALCQRTDREISLDEIREIRILSEKHGALHHVARIETLLKEGKETFALVSALSPRGKESLRQEFETRKGLDATFPYSCLPEIFSGEEVGGPEHAPLADWEMLLQEWLHDYHEWHVSRDDRNGQVILLWDLQRGHRPLCEGACFEVFRQAAKILTLYYDIPSCRQIGPWHHGAGDFVAREGEGVVDVKLTTVRGYDAPAAFREEGRDNLRTALVFFFLELNLRMRIDKRDGTRGPVWIREHAVEATLKGFFEGLRIKEGENLYPLGNPVDLMTLLKAFSREEITRLMDALLNIHPPEDPQDLPLIRVNLERHADDLYCAIQNMS